MEEKNNLKRNKERLMTLEVMETPILEVKKVYNEDDSLKDIQLKRIVFSLKDGERLTYSPAMYENVVEQEPITKLPISELIRRLPLISELSKVFPKYDELVKKINKNGSCTIQILVVPLEDLERKKVYLTTYKEAVYNLDIL